MGKALNQDDYVWADSWKSRQRAKSFQVISSIVERYGGTITEIDLETYTLSIDVPEEHKVECTMKVQEEIDWMCG